MKNLIYEILLFLIGQHEITKLNYILCFFFYPIIFLSCNKKGWLMVEGSEFSGPAVEGIYVLCAPNKEI